MFIYININLFISISIKPNFIIIKIYLIYIIIIKIYYKINQIHNSINYFLINIKNNIKFIYLSINIS